MSPSGRLSPSELVKPGYLLRDPADSFKLPGDFQGRHLAFRERLPVERPLVGLHRKTMFPLERLISHLKKEETVEVGPNDIDLSAWLSLYEEFWQRTGLVWGDLLHYASPLKLPWMEAIAGCPVYISPDAGLQILPSILATERLPVIEVHVDPSGPSLETLMPTLKQVQAVAPLQIFGDQDKVLCCLKELPYEGVAYLILESSLEMANP